MSKHREILGCILEEIRQVDPDAGVVLFGSVARGQERADSDLDLLVVQEVFREVRFADSRVVHEEDGMHLIRGHVEGIRVDLACWSSANLSSTIHDRPYLFYPFTLGTVLRDPCDLAGRYVRVLRQYMQKAPAVVDAWERQLEELARHKADATQPLRFGEWGEFAAYLGKMV